MTVKTRIEPIADFVEVAVRADLSREGQAQAVARFARERLGEAQEQNRRALGRVPPHRGYVDGREGAALETVNPQGGRIVFEFELIDDVLQWIAERLIERSPVESGRYRAGHSLFVDGVKAEFGALLAGRDVPPGAEYTFVNYVAYSRKIEIGKTKSGRDFVVQVPNRIYERTAKDARSRFGNLAQIGFSYRGVIGGGIARGRAGNKPETRYPAIIVSLR